MMMHIKLDDTTLVRLGKNELEAQKSRDTFIIFYAPKVGC
jgi:hypothetical protein